MAVDQPEAALQHDEAGEPDPHIWLDPTNAIAMSQTIAETLSEMDPSHGKSYRANLEALVEELRQLDSDLRAQLSPHQGKTFFVFHPAFGYFANRYGLVQRAVEVGGKEPSAQNLAALIDQARAQGVKMILAQPQFSAQAAEALARAIDGVVVRVDPLAKDYPATLRSIGDAIDKALSPHAPDADR